jgi:PAS domain S-box-containing protein
VALVSGALLASSLVEFYFSYRENKAALVRLEREKAEAAASRIDQFVRAIEDQIGWTTQALSQQQKTSLERLSFDYLLRQAPSITEVSYLDGDGREQLRISRLRMDVVGSHADYSTEPQFLEAKSGKTFFGPVYFREESEPYMTIAMPGKGQDPGVTVAEVNLKFIQDVVSQIRVGKEGYAYVLDSRGNLIAHPDMSLVLKKTSFASLPQVRDAMRGSPMPGDARDQATIARNLQGRQVLTASATIIPPGWLVFVEEPLAEAFAPLYSSMIRTGILLLLGLGVSVMASLLLARKMVNPIQALQARAARIGAGALDERIEIRTGDELEALAEQFNSMAGQLRESYANLEQKVEALRESEATARASLDAPNEVVLLLDTDGVILDANEAAALTFDKTRDELVGLCTWDLFEPEAANRGKAFADRVIRSGEPIQFEDERGGKWWDCIAYPIRDLTGNVSRVAVFARDITKRKLAEVALRNSERRLADIINFLPDATFAIDREGRVLAWNQAIEEMTGVRADEILGEGNCEYGIPFYGERRPLLADLLLKPDQAHQGQYTVIERHQDSLVAENFLPSLRGGTYLWAKARLLYDSEGTVVGAIESMRDITALKQAEHALRESEQAYRNIIENAVEGIFQATPEGRYLSVNPAWAHMCGFSSPEEMIREVKDIASQLYINPEDRARIKRLYDDPGFVKGFEAQFRRKDGGLIWVSITARSVRDESGVLLYYEGTIQDITERKRAELEVQTHREQLRLLASELSLTEERERRRLATDLHDSIGQALAMCKLKLDELRSQASSEVLANDCSHISTLLDQAIQGTRSLTFELSPPVLYELGLEAALESLVEKMQQANGIPIRLSGHGGPKPLSEDTAVLCFRAVQELLVNVIKHARARKIEVSIGRDRGRIRVTVADDGIGFDASETISRKGGKRGFGLFSIKERLQHLGGSLKVDSKPGQGTRITLSAPLQHRPIRKG